MTTTQDTATDRLGEPGDASGDPGTPHSEDRGDRRVGGGLPAATRTAVIAAASGSRWRRSVLRSGSPTRLRPAS
jgi:hypothetical protein